MSLSAIVAFIAALERLLPFATKLIDLVIQARADAHKAAQAKIDADKLQTEFDYISNVEKGDKPK